MPLATRSCWHSKLFTLLCGLLLCLWQTAMADPILHLLVVTENTTWLSTVDEQGNVAGHNTLQVKDILSRAGLQADIQVLPWARAYSMAEHRPNTLIYSIARTSQRENHFIWLGVLTHMQRVFYRLASDTRLAPQSVNEIRSCCKVCVVNHDVEEEFLMQSGFDSRHYISVNNALDCPRLLQTGAAQLLVTDPQQLHAELLRLKLPADTFQPVLALPEGEDLYLAASLHTDPHLIQQIQEAMRSGRAH